MNQTIALGEGELDGGIPSASDTDQSPADMSAIYETDDLEPDAQDGSSSSQTLIAARSQVARDGLLRGYRTVRQLTETLAAPLSPEDQAIQSMADASPTKWHRAHVTWFFETFLLQPHQPGYCVFDDHFNYMFNSYYEQVGERHPRPERGILSRPPAETISQYRRYVDAAMVELIGRADEHLLTQIAPLVALGLAHEQQHQELLLTDIKHALSRHPFAPAYVPPQSHPREPATPMAFVSFAGGIAKIGHDGHGFAFDNEGPRHRVLLHPYRIATRPVTCGEYLEFIADGGYARPELWLSDGWATVQTEGWQAPAYWLQDARKESWQVFTLQGRRPLDPAEAVCHVSFYEAAAFAEWAGKRLPTEAEWEHAASSGKCTLTGGFLDRAYPHPRPCHAPAGELQMFGEVWEWTRSAYEPYPGFRPAAGAVGEYNGKFMIGQQVLRGGSCVTPPGHVRASYRNFFPPAARWQFSGIRLAEDL